MCRFPRGPAAEAAVTWSACVLSISQSVPTAVGKPASRNALVMWIAPSLSRSEARAVPQAARKARRAAPVVDEDEEDAAEPQCRVRSDGPDAGGQGLHFAEHQVSLAEHELAQRGRLHLPTAAEEQLPARDALDPPQLGRKRGPGDPELPRSPARTAGLGDPAHGFEMPQLQLHRRSVRTAPHQSPRLVEIGMYPASWVRTRTRPQRSASPRRTEYDVASDRGHCRCRCGGPGALGESRGRPRRPRPRRPGAVGKGRSGPLPGRGGFLALVAGRAAAGGSGELRHGARKASVRTEVTPFLIAK